nr:RNA-directed DNA polymerase, eukaryota, reverse transcriptase zinc-binding domain protein [Tanacetum cinerariifolium]
IPDANLVKDFRPISLIGSLYKIIAKILLNRLVDVLGDIVKEMNSNFSKASNKAILSLSVLVHFSYGIPASLFSTCGGSGISFWNDQWIGDRPLRDLFPHLYALEDNKNAMVNVKLSDGRLESSFRCEPRSGAEQAQLNELSILVSDVNLRPISDRWA